MGKTHCSCLATMPPLPVSCIPSSLPAMLRGWQHTHLLQNTCITISDSPLLMKVYILRHHYQYLSVTVWTGGTTFGSPPHHHCTTPCHVVTDCRHETVDRLTYLPVFYLHLFTPWDRNRRLAHAFSPPASRPRLPTHALLSFGLPSPFPSPYPPPSYAFLLPLCGMLLHTVCMPGLQFMVWW